MKNNDLRRQAEEKLAKQKTAIKPAKDTDSLRLVHELRVHQIELEMQNEELVQARTETEAALRQYTELFDFAPVGYFTLAHDGTILQANLTAATLLGIYRNELIKSRFGVLVAVESRSVYNAFLEKVFENRQKEICEVLLQKDGAVPFWVHIEASCIEDGEECRAVVVDITERKLGEDELRESEDKYKRLLDNISDIIFTIDLEGKLTFVSRRTQEILGYESAETINMNILNFIPKEDHQRAIESLQKGMKGEKIKHFQIPLIAKSGEILIFECSFSRVYKDGAVIGAQGTAVDITERKKVEEAFRASEEKLQMALWGSEIGLWDLDIATMSGTIDERTAQILGYNKDEILPQSKYWDEMTHPDDVPQIRESLRAHLEGRIPVFETEHRMRKKTGEWKWVHGIGKITKRHIDGSPILISGTVQDITERKRAEEALRESEEKYRRITENMSDFISELDPQGIFKYNSPSIEGILGYNQEELIGSSAFDLVHPDDRDGVIATYMDGVKTETDRYVEQRYRRKDGTYIWLRSSGRPIYGSDGKNIGMIVNSNDITERKKAEVSLRLKNHIFDTSIAANSIADTDGIINEANYAFLRLWGYSSDDDVVGNSISYFLNDQAEAAAIVNTLNEKGEWCGEFTAKKKDGSTFTAYTMATSICDENGKVTGYQSSVIDITERKHFEKLMSMQSDVLKVLISDITVTQTAEKIVDIIKQSTGHDAVGLRLNVGNDYPFVASLGYSEEFLKAENTLTYNYPDGGLCRNADGTISLECICGMIISEKSDPDNQLLTLGGSFWTNNSLPFLDVPPEADTRLHPRNRCIHAGFLSLALIPIRAGKEVIGLLHLANRHQNSFSPATIRFYEGIGISIGVALSRKRAKEEIIRLNTELGSKVNEQTSDLRNTQLALLNLVDDLNQSAKNTDLTNRKLEETNNEIKAFSYSVSHDLRAPLRSIDGFSLALMEDYHEKLDDTGKNYLNKIRAATQHMGLLIEDMLKLSRISHAEFHHESIDLSNLVQSIAQTIQQNNPDNDMKMTIQKGIVIKGDLNSMEIALTNLLENAWKFTGKQKQPLIEFGMTLTEGKKVFFIRDNGVGFDMAYANKLFGAFQRLHSTDEFPGTGIGLATVKRIITRHGGQIWAEGEVGKGATFFFTIPE